MHTSRRFSQSTGKADTILRQVWTSALSGFIWLVAILNEENNEKIGKFARPRRKRCVQKRREESIWCSVMTKYYDSINEKLRVVHVQRRKRCRWLDLVRGWGRTVRRTDETTTERVGQTLFVSVTGVREYNSTSNKIRAGTRTMTSKLSVIRLDRGMCGAGKRPYDGQTK